MDIVKIIMLVWGFVWGAVGICVTCGAILGAVDFLIERWVKKRGDCTKCDTKRDQ